jgi:hypothetical protein
VKQESPKQPSNGYLALMGLAPKRIPHWEHMSNPDFIGHVSGIDPYEKPRSAALKAAELYPDVGIWAPEKDDPVPRPSDDVTADETGRRRTRWGAGVTGYWDWGNRFHTIEEVIAYEPLKHLDLRDGRCVENRDYSVSEDELFKHYGGKQDGEQPPEGEVRGAGFYNTMFMWPLLTFGWELFLELAGGHKDHLRRLLDDFAEINRKVFRVFARLPVNQIVCHDDICMARGPVCSPAWLREFIYPYYEEFFGILKSRGDKRVIFMCDGNIDMVADDVKACGADGFVSEPVTDWKAIARKYPAAPIAGEGDNRILMRNRPEEIEAMVRSMVETAQVSAGYYMCIGNHIPWNVPPSAVKLYFDLSKGLAVRP